VAKQPQKNTIKSIGYKMEQKRNILI